MIPLPSSWYAVPLPEGHQVSLYADGHTDHTGIPSMPLDDLRVGAVTQPAQGGMMWGSDLLPPGLGLLPLDFTELPCQPWNGQLFSMIAVSPVPFLSLDSHCRCSCSFSLGVMLSISHGPWSLGPHTPIPSHHLPLLWVHLVTARRVPACQVTHSSLAL